MLPVVLVLLACTSGANAKASNNVAHTWMNETQAAVAQLSIQGPIASKYYGMVGLAMHEALAAGGAPPPALAAFAAHAILSGSFPWMQGKFDMMLGKQLMSVSSEEKKKAAEIAVPIATRILKERTGDESTRWAMFKPAAAGTLWTYQYAPGQMMSLVPQLGSVTPFKLTNEEKDAIVANTDPSKGPVFRPSRTDYKDTFTKGAKDSKDRTQYETDSVFFWAAGANTSAIPGYWLTIAREVLPADMSLEDTALFYARAGAAAYDAAIATYKLKHTTNAWRPITAFRSGYPGFEAVPNWEPLLPTPPHPEYPSGHTAASYAIADTLIKTLGTDDVTFSLTSEGPSPKTRTYKSISAAAKEVADSRLLAGVHFKSANEDGAKLGKLVASKVFDRVQPAKGASSSNKAAVAAEKGSAGRRLRV